MKAWLERLLLMIASLWESTRTQPIAMTGEISYLVGSLRDERTAVETFDIGGPEILSYRQMIDRFARI